MYVEQVIWIQKTDQSFKDLEKQGWKTALSVKTLSNEIYYCLLKSKHTISEQEKKALLAPLYLVNQHYIDCLLLIPHRNTAYLWQDKKCFILDEDSVSEMKMSNLIEEMNVKELTESEYYEMIESTDIKVRTYSGLGMILLSFLIISILTLIGSYIWLF